MAKKGRPATYQSDDEKPVTISMRLPKALHTRLERYARQHRQSISELMRDGIEWRIGDGDPRGLGDGAGPNNPQEYYGNIEKEHDTQAAEALQEVRALLARQWEQIQALAQALEQQRVPVSDGLYDSNTTMPATDVALSYQEASYTDVATLTDEQRQGSPIPASVPPVTDAEAETETPHQGNTVIQPAFDSTKFYLGTLCPKGHDFGGTGLSLLRNHNQRCRECENEGKREARARKRAALEAATP